MPRGQRFKNIEEKMKILTAAFWNRVIKTDTCWLWNGPKNGDGYGITYNGSRTIVAHRWSYIQLRGEIPEGLCVLHHCDNPPCVNPAHLFLGTRADNNKDMMTKGRNVVLRRERNGQSKLTEEQVKNIRHLYGQGKPVLELSQLFSISRQGIYRVVSGKCYPSLGDDDLTPKVREWKRWITHEGETLTLKEWADRVGITPSGLHLRLKKMPFEQAIRMKA